MRYDVFGDIRKPLAAVSAMNDEGNAVVLSRTCGHHVENDDPKGENHDGEGVRHVRDGLENEGVAGRSAEGGEVGRKRRKEIYRHGGGRERGDG